MSKYKIGSIVFRVLFLLFLISFISNFNSLTFPNFIPALIMMAGCGIGMVLNIIQYNKTINSKEPVQPVQAMQIVNNIKPYAHISGTLVDGLPIPAAVNIIASLYDTKIEFVAITGKNASEHQYFNMDIDKLQKQSY